MLSIILDSLLLREIGGEGLIEDHITDIFLIGQYSFDGTLRPGRFSPGSQNAVFYPLLLCALRVSSLKSAYSIRL